MTTTHMIWIVRPADPAGRNDCNCVSNSMHMPKIDLTEEANLDNDFDDILKHKSYILRISAMRETFTSLRNLHCTHVSSSTLQYLAATTSIVQLLV